MANFDGQEEGRVGFRFDPTDQELINYFLYQKVVAREPLMEPHKRMVHEFNLLGQTEPWLVWEQFGGPSLSNEDLYFFSEVKSLCPKGSRIKRKIQSGGTWTQKEPYTEVLDEENGKPIGRKRKLRYVNEGCEHDGRWVLEEYSRNVAADKSDQQASKIVLCRLRMNNKYCRTKKSNSTQELKGKPKKKKGRKSKELGSERERPEMDIIDDEGPQNCSLLVFDEGNIKKISGSNQHQELIMSGTNYGDELLNNVSVDDHKGNAMMNADRASDLVCLNHGGAAHEEYMFSSDELLGTWPEELPEIAETQVPFLPASGLGDDYYGGLEATISSGFKNLCDQGPLDCNTYRDNSFQSFADEIMKEDYTYLADLFRGYD